MTARRWTSSTRWKLYELCMGDDGKTVTHFGIWDKVECRMWPNGAKRRPVDVPLSDDPGTTLFTDRTEAEQQLATLRGKS